MKLPIMQQYIYNNSIIKALKSVKVVIQFTLFWLFQSKIAMYIISVQQQVVVVRVKNNCMQVGIKRLEISTILCKTV